MSQNAQSPTTAAPAKPEARKPPGLSLSYGEAKDCNVAHKGDWDRLKKAYRHRPVVDGVLKQVVMLAAKGDEIDEDFINWVLAYVDAMTPHDPAEMLLLTQMAATHSATMTMARRLNCVDTIQQQDSAERAMNKLARTFSAQMETLKKYRSKGQQVVRVERVNVESGGQAVVGNVETGGRGDAEK